jgi:hypothetical protein
MSGDKHIAGQSPEDGSQERGIDEVPPLNIREGFELGRRADAAGITVEELLAIRAEERLRSLKELKATGAIEADTEEMKIIAAADSPVAEAADDNLTFSQRRDADTLADRQKDDAREARIQSIVRGYQQDR